ncbi:uncharacterized protein LOC131874612 [Cryptomeria japonica]|uniref:uncharacterized protein LOC131874612 n=1 Tax=Cryptomeria japonica TaxID=3369 RepID=UPI0027DA6621|nr:uncharacterized protein LOC131874612 [Cryptomeria japonica]
MSECEVSACQRILKNVSASTTTHKTRVEHIKQTLDGCTGKLEKQVEDFGIPSVRKSDGKFISLAEFNEVVDSFVAEFESRVRSCERQRNEQVINLVMFATARVERSALAREFIQETIQPLLKELNETKVRVERRLIINTLQIEEDYVSCKEAVEVKVSAK